MKGQKEIRKKLHKIEDELYDENSRITTKTEETEVVGWRDALLWIFRRGG